MITPETNIYLILIYFTIFLGLGKIEPSYYIKYLGIVYIFPIANIATYGLTIKGPV